jgi:outer membrane scaffolding protein for murein synthesis (MipA/OmpV family)
MSQPANGERVYTHYHFGEIRIYPCRGSKLEFNKPGTTLAEAHLRCARFINQQVTGNIEMCSRNIIMSALLTLTLATAHADESASSGWHGMILFGAGVGPQYEGSDDYEAMPLFAGTFSKGNVYMGFEDGTFRANILDSDKFEFGPLVSFSTGREDDIDNTAVAALGSIDTATELGAFGAYSWPLTADSRMRIGGEYLRDVSDVYDSWRGGLSLGYSLEFAAGWSVNVEAALGLVSDDYADTFYSVSPGGASASGLRQYRAQGGADNIGVSLVLGHQLTDKLGLFGVVALQRLLGDAADSPIVADEGDPDQAMVGIGIAYLY